MRRIGVLAVLLAGCERIDGAPRTAAAPIKTAAGHDMILVPAGEFVMGNAAGRGDEQPLHKVKLDAFLMDRTEVSQAHYESLKLPNPSKTKGAELPVHMMSWVLAAKFCNERSRAENLEPCYNEETAECDFSKSGYRLPTEAEWEYACRAGGDGTLDAKKLRETAWFAENAQDRPHPVARRAPNAWGFCDMLGNVAEWCNDVYEKDHYAKSAASNPRGPADGKQYAVRGGSFKTAADALRPTARGFDNPGFADACLAPDTLGLRCVRRPPVPKSAYLQDRAQTGLVYDPIYLEHKTGAGFPERPARLEAIIGRLREKELAARMLEIRPLAAPEEWIGAVHQPEYLARVKKACEALGPDEIGSIDTGDMPICRKSYDVALAAVGGVLSAVDAVMSGKARNAFCAIRPPGHHALPAKAMGFCLFNNVAVAARYIQKKHGLKKVLIVDWDVHHGNGTQDVFYSDGGVMYFSTHLHPFYPGSGNADERGEGAGKGLILNVPLPRGAGDDEVLKAYNEVLKPAALAFRPDFVLVSCGFDSHVNDTLGRMAITSEGFGKMTRILKEIAAETAKGRLVSMMEGGYNLENLANAAEAHVRALME
jgi:acetoin utilization deacetylase AcuC-like enzyme/formylglycine-generating enzyme required for sulfatase activity